MSITPLQAETTQQLLGDVPSTNIEIYDEFHNPQGKWTNYATYVQSDQQQIFGQSHVDIRTFNQNGTYINRTMNWFDTETVSELDSFTVSELEGNLLYQSGEAWTNGTIGPISSLKNWSGLQITGNGSFSTSSVITNQANGKIVGVDISTGFEDTDTISVVLPSFPAGSVDLVNTFIDFTSADDGSFTGLYDSVPFSDTTTAFGSELTFPRSTLVNTDLTRITGIRFRFTTTANVTIKVLAIRLLSSAWEYSTYDQDTLWGGIRWPVPRDGNPADTPYTVPTLWRSNVPPGTGDPQPIDISVAATFSTGNFANTSPTVFDQISFYFRERPDDELIQSNLEVLTQADLDGYAQPDFGTDAFVPLTQSGLDILQQQYLNGQPQQGIEQQPDTVHGSWIRATLSVGGVSTNVNIYDSLGHGYTITSTPVSPNTDYIVIASIQDTKFRAQVFSLDLSGYISPDPILDTGWIVDSKIFKRRPGRFGWSANIVDGDFVIHNIRTRYLNYGEIVTRHFESITPVVGASLQVEGRYEQELFVSWNQGPLGGVISAVDTSNGDQEITVSNPGAVPYQGIMTNPFYIEDFDTIGLNVDILFPSSASDAPLKLYLLGEKQREVPLPLVITDFDRWQTFSLHSLTNDYAQTGPYYLVLVQPSTNTPTTWQVRNTSITQRMVEWSARPSKSDAWGNCPVPWTSFYNTVNDPNGGVLFEKSDRFLQARGQVNNQKAYITNIKLTPKYGQLGRFVWADQLLPVKPPYPKVYITTNGLEVTFDASYSTNLYGKIITYLWNFGDNSEDLGATVTHAYGQSGTYPVTLRETNDQGQSAFWNGTVHV